MGVQVPFKIFKQNEPWYLSCDSGLDFPLVLPHGGRYPLQPEPLVHLSLGPADDKLVGLGLEQPVLGQLESLAYRDLPGGDVVRLRSGEVLQRRTPDVQADDAQVDLETCYHTDRSLCRPADNDLAELLDRFHQARRIVRRGG